MKKILFIAVIFLLQVTTLFADAFLETFPSQALVCWCFESKWATEFLGYSGKDNELTKAYKDICACFEKRFSINIEKDIDKFGAYVIPGQGGVDLIGVVSGKFDTDKIITIIKTILPKTNNKNVKLEDITVNGKKIKYFRDEKNILVFYSKEIIFVAKDSTLNMLKQNAIPFGKAPELVSDLLKKHNSFLFVPKTAIMMLSMMRLPPEITGNVDSIVSYIDNDKINIEIICNNSSAAEQFKTQLEQKRNEYASNYSKEFDNKKKELNEVGVDKLTTNIALMYSSAKAKDFIDGIQLSTSSNYFIIKTKADFGEIIPGIIGLVVPVAMTYAPSLAKNSSKEAKKNACFSNQRVLQGAVEMYNMDNSVMMTKLNAKELLDKKYIKPISKPEPQCQYESVGDLSDDGYINCTYHGSPFKR